MQSLVVFLVVVAVLFACAHVIAKWYLRRVVRLLDERVAARGGAGDYEWRVKVNCVEVGRLRDSSLAIIERDYYADSELYRAQWMRVLRTLRNMAVDSVRDVPVYAVLIVCMIALFAPGSLREMAGKVLDGSVGMDDFALGFFGALWFMSWSMRMVGKIRNSGLCFEDCYRDGICIMVRKTIGCSAKGAMAMVRSCDDGIDRYNVDFQFHEERA